MSIKLASGPGGFIKIGIYCVSGCLEVKIASPATGATMNKSHVIVQGNLYNATGEIGIILHSSGTEGQVSNLTQHHGSSFAGIIPLQVGSNSITAQATDRCGYQAKDSTTISSSITQETIRLITIPSSGIADLVVGLKADVSIANPVATYQWDLNGDGVIDLIGNYPEVTNTYQVPGLYFPRVIVIDNQGIAYEETTIVNALSREEIDVMLQERWEGIRGALVAKDIDKAIGFFEERSKERYKEQFTALKPILDIIANDMTQIHLVKIEDDRAEYEIITSRNGAPHSFHLLFVKDKDGLWKIERF